MLGFYLTDVFSSLSDLGLVRSKRHFSRQFLGHGWSYLRDIEQRDRDEFRVPPATVYLLRARLQALTSFLPAGIAGEVEHVVAKIDQHTGVADMLGYRFRKPVSKPGQDRE